MFFNSLLFVASLIVFNLLYHFQGQLLKRWLLIIAGIGFAWSFSGYDAFFLVAAFLLNQAFILLGASFSKKWLTVGIVANILALFVWKYSWFTYTIFAPEADKLSHPWLNFVVPVGISYYVFRAIGNLIDIRNGVYKPENSWLNAAVYFFYFPIFLQGPVERARTFIPQLNENAVFSWANLQKGIEYFLSGLFLKVVIADRLGVFVNDVFGSVEDYSSGAVFLSVVFYAVQLFADFGGYTRMAIGISTCFGIRLMANFNRPYFATSITDFWRRWHISFSSWLNEYLYSSLSFSFRNLQQMGAVLAVILTFLVSGIWHGVGVPFIIWGLWHGIGLSVEILSRKKRKKWANKFGKKTWNFLGGVTTILFVLAGYVFFRSESLAKAVQVYRQIFSFSSGKFIGDDFDARFNLATGALLAILFLISDYFNDKNKLQLYLESRVFTKRLAWCLILLLGIVFFGMYLVPATFLYFQF
ncbi:MAG: MBOAT family protein [Bacteroidetes bacterium]|nr:MAG: MBOAT family protein [Bacteroidota bacterium]